MDSTGLKYQGKHRTYGFRLSITDVFVLIVASIATWMTLDQVGEEGWIIAFVVFHFFLFCNIFRVRRTPELIWAGLFILSYIAFKYFLDGSVYTVFLIQSLISVAVIGNEVMSPGYHGIFASAVNPVQGKIKKNCHSCESRNPLCK